MKTWEVISTNSVKKKGENREEIWEVISTDSVQKKEENREEREREGRKEEDGERLRLHLL